MTTFLRRLALAAAFVGFAGPALADASDWVKGAKSSVRLVSAGGLADGVYRAGLEIRLAPATLTYWRTPGDAGAPPVFDFAASDNLASAETVFPAPKRIPEAGGEAFGYETDVVLPLRLLPKDASKPVRLRLKLEYAACEKICIPEQATLALDLGPADAKAPEAALIAGFEARAPKPWVGEPPRLAVVAGAAKPTWRLDKSFAPTAVGDLFAEGPDGSFLETKRDGDGFLVVLAQPPLDPRAPLEIRLTRVTPDGAQDASLRLDAAPAKP